MKDLYNFFTAKTQNVLSAVKRMMRLHKNVSIKRKLPLMLSIQIIIPLILIGFMSYKISEGIIRDKSVSYSRDLLSAMKFRVKDYTDNLSLISQNILYEKQIYNVLNNDSANKDPLYNYQAANEINNIFKRLILTRSEIQAIYLVSNNKNYYVAENSGKNGGRVVIPYDSIIQKAREAQGKVVWYLECKDNKVNNIFLARTVYNQDDFKEIGLLVIQAKKEDLESLCEGLANNDIQSIAIISAKNEEIAGKASGSSYQLDEGLLGQIRQKKGSVLDNSKKDLITFVSIDEPEWLIVTSVSLKKLYAEIDVLRQWIILLSGISVLILAVLSVFTTIDFMNPINKLVNAMKSMKSEGELASVKIDRNDEFGFLGKNFNNMAAEINHLVKWIYREQITRKEAELKALQAQINPHFLFNTLESINWMAQLNGVTEISEMVTSLSSLMEASIGRDNKLITIEEEFTYIDHYIRILKNRFGDRINMTKRISEEVKKVSIPKLLIQPLIENAVYHGIEKKKGKEKGFIVLNAYQKEDFTIVEVIDNGPGVEEEELDMINERLTMDSSTYFKTLETHKRKSIGIENVNRRIKLFFGEAYGLKIFSRAGCYTKVVVSIPLQHKEILQDGTDLLSDSN